MKRHSYRMSTWYLVEKKADRIKFMCLSHNRCSIHLILIKIANKQTKPITLVFKKWKVSINVVLGLRFPINVISYLKPSLTP